MLMINKLVFISAKLNNVPYAGATRADGAHSALDDGAGEGRDNA